MEQSKQQRIRELTDRLNRCRYEYYNLNAPSLTDAEYDALFDELSTLEKETGFSMTNSPTQTVGCYHDLLNKQPQQFRCQFRNVRIRLLSTASPYPAVFSDAARMVVNIITL